MCLESGKKGKLDLQIVSNAGANFLWFWSDQFKKKCVQGTEHLDQRLEFIVLAI